MFRGDKATSVVWHLHLNITTTIVIIIIIIIIIICDSKNIRIRMDGTLHFNKLFTSKWSPNILIKIFWMITYDNAGSLSYSLNSYDFLHSNFSLLTKRHIFDLIGAPSFFSFCPYCPLSFSLFADAMQTKSGLYPRYNCAFSSPQQLSSLLLWECLNYSCV